MEGNLSEEVVHVAYPKRFVAQELVEDAYGREVWRDIHSFADSAAAVIYVEKLAEDFAQVHRVVKRGQTDGEG